MTTPIWQAGHVYLPGDLVQPIHAPAPTVSALANPNFDVGTSGWTLGAGWAINSDSLHSYQGVGYAVAVATTRSESFNATVADVKPGQTLTVKCACNSAIGTYAKAGVFIEWQDSGGTRISVTDGEYAYGGNDPDYYKLCTATGVAPAGTAHARLGVYAMDGTSYFDTASWTYYATTLPAGLIYKAVQAGPGTSANTEPAWPSSVGVSVVDNTVTWQAVTASRVVWTASPICKSGAVQPTWPTTVGATVIDGTVSWECISRRVEDVKCPNTKVVAILSGKVFAVDKDIVRFCATANPLDWTSADDAGYLPTGLQQANANDMAVLAPYRSNLCPFNASGMQNWQVDPDPALMALLDQMEGIGSIWPRAAQPVANDLFFLSQLGVRSVGISVGADNLAAGDIGMPIDSLVQASLAINGALPLATYYPGAGQYWLAFGAQPALQAMSINNNLPNGTAGDVVSFTYSSSGGLRPHTFAVISGSLPTGLSMSTAGKITGTAAQQLPASWTVRVTDALGSHADLADSAAYVGLTGTLADGAVGSAYSSSLTAGGGITPYVTYAIASGSLPAGLSINASTGVISGTPT